MNGLHLPLHSNPKTPSQRDGLHINCSLARLLTPMFDLLFAPRLLPAVDEYRRTPIAHRSMLPPDRQKGLRGGCHSYLNNVLIALLWHGPYRAPISEKGSMPQCHAHNTPILRLIPDLPFADNPGDRAPPRARAGTVPFITLQPTSLALPSFILL